MTTAATLSEIAILLLAAYVWLRNRDYCPPAAAALAVGAVLSILSFSLQAALLLGNLDLSLLLEAPASVAGLIHVWRQRALLQADLRHGIEVARRQLLVSVLMGGASLYLLLCAVVLPPNNGDALRYHLPRVLLFAQESSPFLEVVTPHQAHRAVFPISSDVLYHLFLRSGADFGVGLYSFLSWLSIGFGVMAITRRQTTKAIALTATLLVVSLPAVVFHATSTKNDIIVAGVALQLILLAQRLLARARSLDLSLFIVLAAFGVGAKILFLGFLAPLTAMVAWLLARFQSPAMWRLVKRTRWQHIVVVLGLAAILSNVWMFAHNYQTHGAPFGPKEFVEGSSNRDGLTGALANLFRYLFESADFLKGTALLSQRVLNMSPPRELTRLHDRTFGRLFSQSGSGYRFKVEWSNKEMKSWCGPFSFLLLIPSVFFCAIKGELFERVIALTLSAYVLIISATVAWMPWNGRFFFIFFVGAAPCFAAMCKNLGPGKAFHMGVRIGSVAMLFYATLFAANRPLLPMTTSPHALFEGLVRANVWTRTDFGRDRYAPHSNRAGLDYFISHVEPEERVTVLSVDNALIYHFLLARPDLEFTFAPPGVSEGAESSAAEKPASRYVLCIGLGRCKDAFSTHADALSRCFLAKKSFQDLCLVSFADQVPPGPAGDSDAGGARPSHAPSR